MRDEIDGLNSLNVLHTSTCLSPYGQLQLTIIIWDVFLWLIVTPILTLLLELLVTPSVLQSGWEDQLTINAFIGFSSLIVFRWLLICCVLLIFQDKGNEPGFIIFLKQIIHLKFKVSLDDQRLGKILDDLVKQF